jgi:hypothetical protein
MGTVVPIASLTNLVRRVRIQARVIKIWQALRPAGALSFCMNYLLLYNKVVTISLAIGFLYLYRPFSVWHLLSICAFFLGLFCLYWCFTCLLILRFHFFSLLYWNDLLDWVSFQDYPKLFGIKGVAVVVVVYIGMMLYKVSFQ